MRGAAAHRSRSDYGSSMSSFKHRRSLLAVIAAALLVVPLSACSGGFGGASSADSVDPSTRTSEGVAASPESAEMADQSVSGPSVGQQVIHTGDVTLTVSDPTAAATEVRALAERLGGYVESQTVNEESGSTQAQASLSVRVPAEEFDAAFDALSEIGEVASQSRSATDVTLQYVDLEARVDALQASVDRLTALMSGASTTGELIEAESALAQRQQELDGLRAQLTSLESQVGYSTIWVNLRTDSAIPGGPANFWEGLVAGFESLLAAGAAALVVFGILLPWILVLGVLTAVVLLIVWLSHRRINRGGTPR